MAHVKTAGGKVAQGVKVQGKRLGLKKFGGQKVISGNIIVRQHSSLYYPGKNTRQGRDFTIYATAEGVVSFKNMTGYKKDHKLINVLPETPQTPKAEKK